MFAIKLKNMQFLKVNIFADSTSPNDTAAANAQYFIPEQHIILLTKSAGSSQYSVKVTTDCLNGLPKNVRTISSTGETITL
jgi:hypothetical protein